MVKITFLDGAVKQYPKGISVIDVAKDISEGLSRNILSAKLNDRVVEVSTTINEDSSICFYTWDDKQGKRAFWHSSAHLLAQALEQLYPGIKLTIGPAVDNGFYYDVDFGENVFSESDFEKVEKLILDNARNKSPFKIYHVSKAEALSTYENNSYKTELIDALTDGEITFCTHDNFTDLCRGGHIPNTGLVKSVKIMSVAGAYWRGDEKNKQLTRVYGISFPKAKYMTEHLKFLEEAKARDHRRLGKDLELFIFSKRIGQGLPLWLPKGYDLRERLETFLKKIQRDSGYEMVYTPHIGSKELYMTSGHYEKYGEDSFQPIKTPVEDEEFLLKPMNCPHHCEIFKSKPYSYRDLPKRFAEFGTVYRYEKSGELHGLFRVRGFTQDDAHIFCTTEQLKEEFKKVIDMVLYVFRSLGFGNFKAQISLRDESNPQKYIGSDENWERAESDIIEATKEKGLDYFIEYGEAAFYGPKLDFMVKDAIGRSWQLGTIQVDYNLPERFDLSYTGTDDKQYRPVMIHRAPLGSLERFIAILVEHTSGHLPLWLISVQAIILVISDKYEDYAKKVLQLLKNYEIRAEIDLRAEKMGKKVRDAEIGKIPFMLIVGAQEQEDNLVSVREHGQGDLGVFTVEGFSNLINDRINSELNPEKT
ncbi:threonine--tRNA ligase [Ichthyobacterium seriolicida]|uniref:Threonine--tRNA ligase n=1 Tax=Ichthyobacterium seriolicida TaxID=242600 RepID=A0A1J1E9W3_9FLAO|nr:threonine--tRNA ligase [Ichthyobacterium seriolicida]BAV94312.1 threonyl-tRNA synthetase [Ichthyobacterium seriolicida]